MRASSRDPLAFSHEGRRFLLGWGEDFFGIWDRERPGAPVATFPRTDDGWAEAWRAFVAREPEPVEVPRRPPPPRPEAVGFRPAGARARAAAALVGLVGAISTAEAALELAHIGVLRRFRDRLAPLAEVRASEARIATLEGLGALALLAAGLAWLLWQHRAHANLWALGVPGLRFSPGWAVGWWFVPLANLVMPYLAVRELRRASTARSPRAPTEDAPWPSPRGPGPRGFPLVPLWWGAWVGSNALALAGVAVGDPRRVSTVIAQSGWFAASELATVVAAALALAVVLGVERGQERLRRTGPSTAPAWPPGGG
ncbi:MAG TPA: DUF4328 domain-containing protein [Actinomycetota bacterium]|nr:DUF4328 domain-containing protein [Actinomycetota bacterium]